MERDTSAQSHPNAGHRLERWINTGAALALRYPWKGDFNTNKPVIMIFCSAVMTQGCCRGILTLSARGPSLDVRFPPTHFGVFYWFLDFSTWQNPYGLTFQEPVTFIPYPGLVAPPCVNVSFASVFVICVSLSDEYILFTVTAVATRAGVIRAGVAYVIEIPSKTCIIAARVSDRPSLIAKTRRGRVPYWLCNRTWQ